MGSTSYLEVVTNFKVRMVYPRCLLHSQIGEMVTFGLNFGAGLASDRDFEIAFVTDSDSEPVQVAELASDFEIAFVTDSEPVPVPELASDFEIACLTDSDSKPVTHSEY